MRAFIAIELSDEIRETLSQIQSHLKYSGADVKWVAIDNIHLTLKFLGEIDEEKCEKIKIALEDIAKSARAFEISLKDSGVFPKIESPRVIWVGLDKGAKESAELAGRIDAALSRIIGFQQETRPFAAHLTIGRVRSSKNKDALKEKLTSRNPHPISHIQMVTAITLFQSKLTSEGPIYTKLCVANLAN